MKGFVKIIRRSFDDRKYGYIYGEDQKDYYFDSRFLSPGLIMDNMKGNDKVAFTPGTNPNDVSKLCAKGITLAEEAISVLPIENTPTEEKTETDSVDMMENNRADATERIIPIRFFRNGYSKSLLQYKQQNFDKHLKPFSREEEVLEKLSKILYISYINHHDMGHNNLFPYCLIGTTEVLKQYIRGKFEFLLVFSHFNNGDWQQNTLRASKEIRRTREVAERRPLVNFYMLISNARDLKQQIDRIKGGTDAAVIPFSFDEILKCNTPEQIKRLLLDRFDEYFFENNMLGEENPIEEDTLLFGDRGKIADSIVQRCKSKNRSGIFGLRRSGKSSVLRAVMRRLDYESIKYVKIEARSSLENVKSYELALFNIAQEIRKITLGLQQEEGESREEFTRRLKLRSNRTDYDDNATQYFVEDVKEYTKNEDTFVIAIDEIELITYNTATSKIWQDLQSYKAFWGALRDCECPLILCGVNSTINEKSCIEFNGQTCDNPMFGRIHNCAESGKTYLPPFTSEQTRIMLNTLGGYSNVAFDNVYDSINRTFGGQPFAIRQFCAYMFNQTKTLRKPHELYQYSQATFDRLNDEFCSKQQGIELFTTILQHITIYKDEYEMLKRLALNPEKIKTVEMKDMQLIDHLEKYGLIEYDQTTKFITFRIHAIQEYIKKTTTKRPEDMDNDERRHYVHDCVAEVEKALKRHILTYYTKDGKEMIGASIIFKECRRDNNGFDETNYIFRELFDHKKYTMYFSKLKWIIYNNWGTLGNLFESHKMKRERFKICMEDLNAGRTDADHYDASNMNSIEIWDISDNIIQSFTTSYNAIKSIFDQCGL